MKLLLIIIVLAGISSCRCDCDKDIELFIKAEEYRDYMRVVSKQYWDSIDFDKVTITVWHLKK